MGRLLARAAGVRGVRVRASRRARGRVRARPTASVRVLTGVLQARRVRVPQVSGCPPKRAGNACLPRAPCPGARAAKKSALDTPLPPSMGRLLAQDAPPVPPRPPESASLPVSVFARASLPTASARPLPRLSPPQGPHRVSLISLACPYPVPSSPATPPRLLLSWSCCTRRSTACAPSSTRRRPPRPIGRASWPSRPPTCASRWRRSGCAPRSWRP